MTAANSAFRLVPYLFSACVGSELPSTDDADEALLAAFNASVLVEGRRITVRALQFILSALWYRRFHVYIKTNADYGMMKALLQSGYIIAAAFRSSGCFRAAMR